ncbi:hypothetical protein CR203_15915 [Salipaludibacillus neizhouensis]|uniref:YusW-like protein n=1 Tax=Salipaludibacillus neizhouensis TaxID=885475 RepID=A0A3A9KFJ3_9BACI|nr:YusW family protein [Salipaludibacillus neizhouensis]RKL66375.1 hypothetical protein CR203_15915 [Salipaludibacillus neizhouensis]
MERLLFIMLFFVLLLTACGNGNEELDPNEESMDVNFNENISADLNDNELDLVENNQTSIEDQDTQNGSKESSSFDYGVDDFDLGLEFQDGDEWDYDYDYEEDKEAEIEKENGEKIEISGPEAIEEIEIMLQEIQITPPTSEDDAIAEILNHLTVSEQDLLSFELEIDFNDGEELDVSRSY